MYEKDQDQIPARVYIGTRNLSSRKCIATKNYGRCIKKNLTEILTHCPTEWPSGESKIQYWKMNSVPKLNWVDDGL